MTTTNLDHRGAPALRLRLRSIGRRRGRDPTLARLFARFALSGLAAMIVIGTIGFVVVRHSATTAAIRQAKELTELAGRGIAEPQISPGVLRGDPAALARLDHVVRTRIVRGTPIVRVKVWNADGRIIYSNAPQLIGSAFPLAADALRALRGGGPDADASDLSSPEDRAERRFNRLVEVYVRIRGPGGAPLLYEDYERSSTISASSRRQWMGLAPALIGALLVLYLVQVPLAYSLARRMRNRQREREELLRRAIDASDLERRRIAADLHDGAVQRLAGISLSLAACANNHSHAQGNPSARDALVRAAADTRETIRELRTLLVDIYPATLRRSGLHAALSDLVAPLQASGTTVSLDAPQTLELPDDVEALIYRVSQEALRNARTHAQATQIVLSVQQGRRRVLLDVVDNGRGFAPDVGEERRQANHFGLRLMRDLADHAGGRLSVPSAPGHGTAVRLEVPLQ